MIKTGTLATPEHLFFCLARLFSNWIWKSAWLRKSLLNKWASIVLCYLESAGSAEVSSPDWSSIANTTIQSQRTDWLFVSIVQINPPTFILINSNWTGCVGGSSSASSGHCSEDTEADLITLPWIWSNFPSQVFLNAPRREKWLLSTTFEPLRYLWR